MGQKAAMWNRSALLPTLSGRWALKRTVEDRRSGEAMAAINGTALFATGLAGKAAYSESVTVSLEGGPSMPGKQRYFYCQEVHGLSIFFDGSHQRLFHRLVLESEGTSLVAIDVHRCTPDRYDSHYEFRHDGTFTVTHTVEGPRKSYVSKTLYFRSSVAACIPIG
jgi:hypothetical protein